MDLGDLDAMFDSILEEMPKKKKALVDSCGEKLHKAVLANIGNHEVTGNLKEGCVLVKGSYGGYAAVRNDFVKAPHGYLLENGHRVINKQGFVGWAPGLHMYRNAIEGLTQELENDGEKMLNDLLGGIT